MHKVLLIKYDFCPYGPPPGAIIKVSGPNRTRWGARILAGLTQAGPISPARIVSNQGASRSLSLGRPYARLLGARTNNVCKSRQRDDDGELRDVHSLNFVLRIVNLASKFASLAARLPSTSSTLHTPRPERAASPLRAGGLVAKLARVQAATLGATCEGKAPICAMVQISATASWGVDSTRGPIIMRARVIDAAGRPANGLHEPVWANL